MSVEVQNMSIVSAPKHVLNYVSSGSLKVYRGVGKRFNRSTISLLNFMVVTCCLVSMFAVCLFLASTATSTVDLTFMMLCFFGFAFSVVSVWLSIVRIKAPSSVSKDSDNDVF